MTHPRENIGGELRRTRSGSDDDSSLPLPHHVFYPAIGALLGLGLPLGALLLRFLASDHPATWTWVCHEISENDLFYGYMGVGAVAAFILYGFSLGRRSEEQRVWNATLRRRIEKLNLISVKDPLTRAFSHAYMQEHLELEVEAARRNREPLSIVMLDFDDFKKINDTFGHLFGDHVLQHISETIRMNVRLKDVLCRYGGEEFVILMPQTELETARQVAERVRVAVALEKIRLPRGYSNVPEKYIQITLSLGVATLSGRTRESAHDLLRRADVNLYRAKHAGKNRTCFENAPTQTAS